MSGLPLGTRANLGWLQKIWRDLLSRIFRKTQSPPTAKMQTGAYGENLAARYLKKLGWKIVTQNWRSDRDRRDEIDIVARDGQTLVFVEVKTRTLRPSAIASVAAGSEKFAIPSDAGAYEAVDSRKKRALARAVQAYLRALHPPPAHHRFDIIEVLLPPNSLSETLPAAPEIRHHRSIPLLSRRY